jgi:polysaccharide pyruvyl transferase CsaB
MKIVLSGYYGFNNAGDELILESIVREIRAGRKDADITVLSVCPEMTTAHYRVKAINRWNWSAVIRAVRSCDMLLSGGGGLFQDGTGSLSLYYYLLIILIARLFGKKVFIYGVGVNKLRKCNARLTAWVLNQAFRITVREDESCRLLLEWGCRKEKIELTADPVLLMDVDMKEINHRNPQVTLILRPPRQGKWPVETFAKLADVIQQRLSARIVLIPFHLQQDMAFTHAVQGVMNMPSTIVEWRTTQELRQAVGLSDIIISQRLHGLILAALHGVPLIGISDDPKIDRFLRELGQKNIMNVADVDHYSLLPVILDTWEWRDDFRKKAHTMLPSFKIRARRMSELLFRDSVSL